MTSLTVSQDSSKVWQLERYARLTSDGIPKMDINKWEYFNNATDNLELSLINDQIFIHSGRILLESIPLQNVSKWMRGVSKGDSILIIYKLQNESRRFRMKFSPTDEFSAERQCRKCVDDLTKYFPMKLTTSGTEPHQVSSTQEGSKVEPKILEGEVTLGQVTKAILQEDNLQLPSVYYRCSNLSAQSLSTAVRLCLADPTFPDFVDQVEKELEKIKQECA